MAVFITKVARWFVLLAALLAGMGSWTLASSPVVPATGSSGGAGSTRISTAVNTSRPDQVSLPLSVSVPGLFSFQVVQQPQADPAFVSTRAATVTQFSLADSGTIGLLAHNYLAGAAFTKMMTGAEVVLNFASDRKRFFEVSSIHAFQALSPTDPYSDFIDLDHPGVRMTSTDVFNSVYQQGDAVVFQTCIARNGNSSWGRLFITARPFNPRSMLVRLWKLGLPFSAASRAVP